jgi:class 3 adenylate cyclase
LPVRARQFVFQRILQELLNCYFAGMSDVARRAEERFVKREGDLVVHADTLPHRG